jgi:hypothetical protein
VTPVIEHPDARPTVRQIHLICRLVLERIGRTFPETRQAAHDLIDSLKTDAA